MKNRDKTEGQLSVPLSLRDFYCAFCIEGQGQIYISVLVPIGKNDEGQGQGQIYI